MKEIDVPFADFLKLRRSKNSEIYCQIYPDAMGDSTKDYAEVFTQVSSGIVLKSFTRLLTPDWDLIKNFVNKPISFYDKRITTHDLASKGTWPLVNLIPDSNFVVAPSPGLVMYVTSIQVKFPANAKIPEGSNLYFKVSLNIGGVVTVVLDLGYPNLFELIKKSNTIEISPPISSISPMGLVDLSFLYCDANTLAGAPIVLRGSLGEHLDIGISSNTPICNVMGTPLQDNKCWAIINNRQCVDF